MPSKKTHFSINQAGAISIFTLLVGNAVAVVPAWASFQTAIIQGGSFLIAGVFMLVNSIHRASDKNVSLTDVKNGAIDAARHELGKVDLNAIVQDAVNAKSLPEFEHIIEAKVQEAISGLALTVGPAPQVVVTEPPVAPDVPPQHPQG